LAGRARAGISRSTTGCIRQTTSTHTMASPAHTGARTRLCECGGGSPVSGLSVSVPLCCSAVPGEELPLSIDPVGCASLINDSAHSNESSRRSPYWQEQWDGSEYARTEAARRTEAADPAEEQSATQAVGCFVGYKASRGTRKGRRLLLPLTGQPLRDLRMVTSQLVLNANKRRQVG
jgi:hypothetical protein